MFSSCTLLPDSKEAELGSSHQEACPSAGKDSVVFLVSCCGWLCVPTAISGDVNISIVAGCHMTGQFPVRVTKIMSRIGWLITHSLHSVFDVFFNSMNYDHIV